MNDKLALTASAGWSELPSLRRFEGQPGKIPARAGRIELCSHYAAGCINLDTYRHSDGPLNRLACALRHLGQDLGNDTYTIVEVHGARRSRSV
jgi:hypothetical protein